MSRTSTRGIRLTEAELKRARRLAGLHPAATSEADLLRTIFLRGLLIEEAAQAEIDGSPPGMSESQLAAGLLAPVLTALQFLARMGVIPQAVQAPAASAQTPTSPVDLDESAADIISGLGGAFL